MASRNEQLRDRAQKVLVGNYKQAFPIVRGSGLDVFDADGKRYLDMFGGIATCALGHSHPKIVAALEEQAHKLWHITNGYYIEPQIELAERLTRVSGLERAFFCNSGGEANEAALKLARKFHKDNGRPGRFEIISFNNSFHGRTLATTAATGQAKYQKGFEPLPQGFVQVDYNDLAAVERAINERTAAIWVEPIQGEGGVRIPRDGFLKGLRELCDKHGLLLLADEVQTGMGRTGTWFACQHEHVRPDVMTLAKAIGNGMPLGAMLCTEAASRTLTPGTHGSTFGGNPLATAVGVAVFDVLEQEKLIERCAQQGEKFRAALREALAPHAKQVAEVRGKGLLIGVELTTLESAKLVTRARAQDPGVLFNAGAEKVVRIAPSFLVTDEQIRQASAALASAIAAETQSS
jgi:acetylornithine/N-succinyldiaminopimelate aminotransferase